MATHKTTTVNGKTFYWGTGRRKTSVARVRLTPGTGDIQVNGTPFNKFFTLDLHRQLARSPLQVTGRNAVYNVIARVDGGGVSGQAGALTLGIARALIEAEPDLEVDLKAKGLLTRDPRMVERKKYAQAGARRRWQFSKR